MDESRRARGTRGNSRHHGREGEGAMEAHDLRTRHSGPATFIEFHLVVPAICGSIARMISATASRPGCAKPFRGLIITIHVEPENKAKHSGIVVLCDAPCGAAAPMRPTGKPDRLPLHGGSVMLAPVENRCLCAFG